LLLAVDGHAMREAEAKGVEIIWVWGYMQATFYYLGGTTWDAVWHSVGAVSRDAPVVTGSMG